MHKASWSLQLGKNDTREALTYTENPVTSAMVCAPSKRALFRNLQKAEDTQHLGVHLCMALTSHLMMQDSERAVQCDAEGRSDGAYTEGQAEAIAGAAASQKRSQRL
jgi:hypothetical protein